MNQQRRKVCVLGLGYIGLPTASLLGTKGYQVVGVDVSADVVETINSGRIHIVEPDLDILVKSAVQSGNLRASLAPDLSYVEAAARSVATIRSAAWPSP
ncbi:UDP-N-acetyl-D-mannosaminuronic acid dehydrogenase (fragment) [Candidatus Defluviicoccus seviourii]|uniref:UDP-N-acetyl-D-mannosaminuronic acid dehydrogenase n=1 Tax=Candidatus Defluviicoccus seviourii TaxID=2565273 RepID=A0A564WEG9_9PROT